MNNKYIFILGQAQELAKQEIISILDKEKNIEKSGENFIIASSDQNPAELINVLGGTVKIARFLEEINNLSELAAEKWKNYLPAKKNKAKKFHFGFSLYGGSQTDYKNLTSLALQIKKDLKGQDLKVRLVSSREKNLSSVIVAKNNLLNSELLIIKNKDQWILGITEAVQNFAAYGQRDVGRPALDNRSGILPPKLAQMMINLAGKNRHKTILDPFCGSGTILQEASLLGFEKIYGSDLSQKAVNDSIENIKWLKEKLNLKDEVIVKKIDAQKISQAFPENSVDLIVTEPFMGDARFIQKQKNIKALENTKKDLQKLYSQSFKEMLKILKPGGKIVFAFPVFTLAEQKLFTLDKKIIEPNSKNSLKLLFHSIYSRPDQKVQREITLWQKL